jgi:hypothetical protein
MHWLPLHPSRLRLALPWQIPQSAPAASASNSCRECYVRLACWSLGAQQCKIVVFHFEGELTQGCWHWNGHIDHRSMMSFLSWYLQDA